jgi:hypothetical protein
MCGALTVPTGLNTNVIVNNILASVVGDIDSHNGLGPILQMLNTRVLIGGIPAVPAIASGAMPDVMGIIPHLQGLPIPIMGSPNVMIGQGNMMAAIGMMQQLGLGSFGGLQIGELVGIGQQIMGQVMNFTQLGGGSAIAQIGNIPSGAPALGSGATVTGQTSGYSFTFANYIDSRVASYEISLPAINTVTNALVQDDGQYIVIDDYFNLYPTQNLTLSVVTV